MITPTVPKAASKHRHQYVHRSAPSASAAAAASRAAADAASDGPHTAAGGVWVTDAVDQRNNQKRTDHDEGGVHEKC
jgi:hypothetical protein